MYAGKGYPIKECKNKLTCYGRVANKHAATKLFILKKTLGASP